MPDHVAVELAVQDAAGARVAASVGADRVELCSALALGGLTPSPAVVERCVAIGVAVHVLVRPRPGDFVYSAEELEVALADVRRVVAAGVAGVVVGALDDEGRVDPDALARFVEAAGGVAVTFHRAVDVAADPVSAVASLAGRGVTRVLTSGGAASAYDGREVLRRMVAETAGALQVMAGAGIDASNVAAVADTGVDAVHLSARRRVGGGGLPLGASDDGGHDLTDPDLARAILRALGR